MDSEFTSESKSTSKSESESRTKWRPSPFIIKSACAMASLACLRMGLRVARRPLKDSDYPEGLSATGMRIARRALNTSVVITVSSFSLLILTVSILLGVNTPRQFGAKMRSLFGDRFRINRHASMENYDSLSELIEAYSNKQKDEKK